MPPKKKAAAKKPAAAAAAEESDEERSHEDYDDDDNYDEGESYDGFTERSQASSRSGRAGKASSSSSSALVLPGAAEPLPGGGRSGRGGGGGGGAFTSISKMAIQGIRAFSPNKECTIEFYKPLTMIVGANGCGKTTIIECLKYATTGLSPPGGDKGRFVHDPKIAGMPEVKASIKLRFTNRAGQDMVVIRSLQLTQKKTQSTFKTLDGVLKQTDPRTGEKSAMSHKCGELDKLIPNLMGVSKSIMENVIFCHQEESSWPLADPASLKKKFDDIFESSRYSKALETIRKTKLEYTNKSKEMKVELASLDAYRDQAEVIQGDLDKLNKTMDRYEGRESKYASELSEVAAELEVHRQQERKAAEKRGQVEGKERALDERRAVLAEKESNLGDNLNLDQGEEAIRQNIANLDVEVAGQAADIEKLNQKLTSSETRLAKASQDLGVMLDAQGQLKSELQREQDVVQERFQLGSAIGAEYGLGVAFPASPEKGDFGEASYIHKVDSFTACLQEAEMVKQTELMTAESAFDDQVRKTNSESLAIQKELAEMEGRLCHQEETHKKLDSEFETVSKEMTSMSRVRHQVRQTEDAKKRKEEIAEELGRIRANPRNGEINVEIRNKDKAIKELNGDISEYRQAAEGFEGRKNEEDKLQLALDQAEDDLQTLREKVDAKRGAFRELEGGRLDVSTENLAIHKADLFARRQSAMEAEEAAKQKHSDTERLLLQKETTLEGVKRSADLARNELSAKDPPGAHSVAARRARLQEKYLQLVEESAEDDDTAGTLAENNGAAAAAAGGIIDLDTMEAWLEKNKIESQESLDSQGMNATFFKGLIESAQEKKKCWCCRHIMNDAEFAAFNARLNKAMKVDPEEQKADEEHLEKTKSVLLECQVLKREAAVVDELFTKVGGFENEMGDLEGEIARVQVTAASAAEALAGCASTRQTVVELEEEVNKVGSEFQELSRRKEEANERMERLQSQVDPLSASQHLPRSLHALKFELRTKEEQRDKLSEEVRDRNEEKMRLMSQVQSKEHELRVSSETYEQLATAAKRLKDLEERKASLSAEISSILASTSKLKYEISPKESLVAEKTAIVERLTSKWKQDEQRLRGVHTAIAKAAADLERLNNQVSSGVKRGTSERVRLKLEESSTQQARIDKYNEKVAEYKEGIVNASQRGVEKGALLKEARENLSVLEARQEVATLEEELMRLKEVVRQANEQAALGSQGQTLRSRQQCEHDKSTIEQDRAENRGKMATLERQVGELKQRLKEPNYRNVKERTRRKRVELETTHMCVEDLEKYWGALDKALLRFHGQKISDINRIIRELWQRTYCGEDIDGIEIVSGEEGGSTRAARSYNYRVVMRKGDTALDMRGRCSAGQRVLACIVIRLALAETFCLSCGILTLDEPTTNLDEYNKTGLANALAEIISVRAKQRNFQLVVITHDADFVTHMRDAFNSLGADRSFNLPEYYWRISRNQTGHNGQYCSEIHRTDWDDM